MEPSGIFSTACFPSVETISLMAGFSEVIMEISENYVKQSNRNRYHIAGPDGLQSLFVPLVHQHLNSAKIKDVKISYDTTWQRTHWRSITSAYNRSAFFEFYSDELEPVFFKKHTFLFDFNEEVLNWILTKLKIKIIFSYTSEYKRNYSDQFKDFRYLSNKKDNTRTPGPDRKKYLQVFEYKNGFIENLSILDLIFNAGPLSKDYL